MNHRYLHEHPEAIQPELYDATHPDKRQLVECRIDRPSFVGFNMVETFDDYRWSGVIDFDPSAVHRVLVREWMRTLRRVAIPDHPEQLRLIDSVRGHEIEMTVPRIRELFHVDTLEGTHYQCIDTEGPNPGIDTIHMNAILYQPTAQPTTHASDSFANLTPLARVLQKVIVENVNPRKSDMERV